MKYLINKNGIGLSHRIESKTEEMHFKYDLPKSQDATRAQDIGVFAGDIASPFAVDCIARRRQRGGEETIGAHRS